MKSILVDDELLALELFALECQNIKEIEIIGKFESSLAALTFARNNRVDFAVLDIQMPDLDGIELGKKLQELYPDIIIVFITGHGRYALDAFNLRAVAFLLKPYDEDDIRHVIQTAKLLSRRLKKRVFVKTFGRFDVFVDDKLLHFSNSKAKELLALLVDHEGGAVTSEQAATYLWEDRPFDENTAGKFRHAAKDLRDTLKHVGITGLIIENKNQKAINRDLLDCDYYQLLDGDKGAIADFFGEYMTNYSWGEATLARIENILQHY